MLKAIRTTFRGLFYIPKPQDYNADGDDIHWEDTSVFTYHVKGGTNIKPNSLVHKLLAELK